YSFASFAVKMLVAAWLRCVHTGCETDIDYVQEQISWRFVATHDDFRKPILEGKGATDYERYIRTDDLLALQTPIDQLSHPDELTFQVVHQSSELLMKGAAWELERARIKITEDDCANAARLMRRANAMLQHPISLLHILETIT